MDSFGRLQIKIVTLRLYILNWVIFLKRGICSLTMFLSLEAQAVFSYECLLQASSGPRAVLFVHGHEYKQGQLFEQLH